MRALLYLSTPLIDAVIKCRDNGVPITIAKAFSVSRARSMFYYGSKYIIESETPYRPGSMVSEFRKRNPLRYRVLIRRRDFVFAKLLLGDLREGWE